MNLALWLPILAVFFGFGAHALSTDGGGSVLARLGVTNWAIPKGAVTPLVLAFGLAAAVFEGVETGLGWQEAAAKGVLASLSALFGVVGSQHLTGRDADGRPLGVFAVAAALAFSMQACAAFRKVEPFLPTADQIACVELEADASTPALVVLTKCGLAQDALAFVDSLLLGHKKAKAMRVAYAAADGGAR